MGSQRRDTLRGLGASPERRAPAAEVAWVDADRLLERGYRLLDRLGVGGMGEVWRARHLGLDRLVAIKRMRSDHPESNDRPDPRGPGPSPASATPRSCRCTTSSSTIAAPPTS